MDKKLFNLLLSIVESKQKNMPKSARSSIREVKKDGQGAPKEKPTARKGA